MAWNEQADLGVRILGNLLRDVRGGAGFRVWDNVEHRVGSQSPAFTFVVRDPAVLRQLVIKRSPLLLADAYFRGRVDFEGDLYAALGLKQHFKSMALSLRESAALLLDALRLPSRSPPAPGADALHGGRAFRHRHSRDSDREAIAFHYDASNDFYRLWLDEQMVYSCAVFEAPSDTLEQAQCNKLDLVCRKLRLQPGERFLDIGCGWGALVIWAAKHYGVQAHGITLSQAQLDEAKRRIAPCHQCGRRVEPRRRSAVGANPGEADQPRRQERARRRDGQRDAPIDAADRIEEVG